MSVALGSTLSPLEWVPEDSSPGHGRGGQGVEVTN